MKKIKKTAIAVLSVAFWIIIWQIISKKVSLDLIIPSPAQVFKRLIILMGEKEFYITVSFSILRIITGFVFGMVSGVILGIISFFSKIAEKLIFPMIEIIKATPVASFIVMVFLFFAKSNIPVFICMLMVLPISYESFLFGMKGIDRNLLEFAKIYRFSKFSTAKSIYFPTVIKHISTAAKTSFGLAWKAGIAAEVIANPPNSIGKKILESKTYLESADLYAWTITVIVISIFISAIFKKALNGKSHDKN